MISPCYLMSELFDCCGWTGPKWMQCQREMRRTLPVIHRQTLYVENGVWTDTLSEQTHEQYDPYCVIEYYARTKMLRYESQ